MVRYEHFNENFQYAVKHYKELGMDLIESVNDICVNKNNVAGICLLIKNSQNVNKSMVKSVVQNYEYYLDTKTYFKLDLKSCDFMTLISRNQCYNLLFDLPKLFKEKNQAIRGEYDTSYFEIFNNIVNSFRVIDKLEDQGVDKLIRVICAKDITFERVLDVLQKTALDFSEFKYDYPNLIESSNGILSPDDLVYNQVGRMVLRLDSYEKIRYLSKDGYWCYSYDNSEYLYTKYSKDGVMYMLIDTNRVDNLSKVIIDTPRFFTTDIKNLKDNPKYTKLLFDRLNSTILNPDEYLLQFFNLPFDEISKIIK